MPSRLKGTRDCLKLAWWAFGFEKYSHFLCHSFGGYAVASLQDDSVAGDRRQAGAAALKWF